MTKFPDESYPPFDRLIGKTLTKITGGEGDDRITFDVNDGTSYALLHQQDCCESVYVIEVIGDMADLLGRPITQAEEVSGTIGDPLPGDARPEIYHSPSAESLTWTFYKLATIKGSVTIRWLGSSNGYYSEAVLFVRL